MSPGDGAAGAGGGANWMMAALASADDAVSGSASTTVQDE
jgi:hypothetical protein